MYSEDEDSDEEPPETKRKKTTKRRKDKDAAAAVNILFYIILFQINVYLLLLCFYSQAKELEKFANEFQEECELIEQFELVVDKSG